MEYLQALEWIHGLKQLDITRSVPPLEQMKQLLAALGDPQRRLRFVHVAGTNGKGSTVMMLASILRQAGYKTGANISPYVLDFRERFLIDGEMIREEQLAKILSQVKLAVEGLGEPPIEFVAVTAAAFLYFEQEGCDIVCLEAGIGGRLDATNIVENTLVACILQIGYDHTEILGDTLAKIAAEKCGIIKGSCPVICYPIQPKEAAGEILLQAGKAKSTLTVPSMQDFHFYKGGFDENRVYYGGYELQVPFLGRHQALNAAVALEAALALWRQGFDISDEDIVAGIAAAHFYGRIELLAKDPLVILDGAHNEDSGKALARMLRRAKLERLTAVMGVMKDKEAELLLKHMAPYIGSLYTVQPNNPRALEALRLTELAEKHIPVVHTCEGVEQALEEALHNPGKGVLVFGSLYLVAQARPLLLSMI